MGLMRAVYDTTNAAVGRQGAEEFLYFQGIPVVGVLISIPVGLYSLGKIIEKIALFAKEAFNKQDPTKTRQDLKDWGIVFLNQVVNLLSLGILNNIFVHVALYEGVTGETSPLL